MSSLKNIAITGASSSLIGKLLKQGSQFVFGIILARLLLPEEYGLVAMAMVFIAVFQVFVSSGFGTAIVQRKEISNRDLSTIFYLNLGVSLICYLILYFGSEYIAIFYDEPELVYVVRVISFILILFALTIVQNAIIVRKINFKILTRIELISQILSSVIAIYLAYNDWGVWAIVWKTLLNQIFVNIQLWLHSNWYPSLVFSKSSFVEIFSFSSKLLISGILDTGYRQIYILVVGKFFPTAELGFYTRAEQFKKLPSQVISGSLLSFLLPVFSKMQNEQVRLKKVFINVIKIVMFININLMIFLGIIAKPMIIVLLGNNWAGTIPYLQLLVLAGIFYPLHAVNVQLLTSLGRSDLFLKIEIIKKLISIPTILLAIFVSIEAMIVGMIITSIIALTINTYYTKKLIDLGFFEQIKSISKSFLIAGILGVVLFPVVYFLDNLNYILLLVLISFTAFFLVHKLALLLKVEEYFEIKNIFFDLIKGSKMMKKFR